MALLFILAAMWVMVGSICCTCHGHLQQNGTDSAVNQTGKLYGIWHWASQYNYVNSICRLLSNNIMPSATMHSCNSIDPTVATVLLSCFPPFLDH